MKQRAQCRNFMQSRMEFELAARAAGALGAAISRYLRQTFYRWIFSYRFLPTKEGVMAITDWPKQERPREKLLARGAQSLTDSELLAIFLRTGVPGRSAVDLARDLLLRFGGLRRLLEASGKEFCAVHGLGEAKFAQLQAGLEMARRHLHESLQQGDVLTSPSLTRLYLQTHLRDEAREVFAVLFLDNQHRMLAFERLFYGTIDGASVHPREVVKHCLRLNAAAVIIAHNHPSGIAEPSQADRRITDRLREALALVDIRLVDHVVVGANDCVSFSERGWL
jgi:DNA repair protein RadC